MRTKISFHRNENKYIKSLFGKSSLGGLRTPVDRAIFFLFLPRTCINVLCFFDQSYDFSRKSLSKYRMDTIDFNKHDIDIFINLAKIVCYGRH